MATLQLIPDPGTRVLSGGRVLVGGSPLRVLTLSVTGARLVRQWFDGDPVAEPHRGLAGRLLAAGVVHPQWTDTGITEAAVTVVVPVRDHAEDLARLRCATSDLGCPVLVVDDGSAVPVPDAAIRHPVPLGPAAARNAGWRGADTELVAFLDADVLPEPGWLHQVLPHFADPAVAAVAPRVRSLGDTTLLHRYERVASGLDLGGAAAQVRPGGLVSYLPSAALVVRRSALAELDGFDDTLRFGEDVDLVWRLVLAGKQVRYEPAAQVGHQPRDNWALLLRQRFCYGTSAAPLALRHGTAVAPVRMSVWSALSWALVAAGRPRLGLATAAVTAALLPVKLRRSAVPATELVRLAATGHLYAGRLLADALTRSWWPVSLLLLGSRRGRVVLAAALARHLLGPRGTDPARWVALRALDDLAYGAGVWCGALRHRSTAALRPDFTEWRP